MISGCKAVGIIISANTTIIHSIRESVFARALVDAGIYVGKRTIKKDSPSAVLWADSRRGSLSSALRGLRKWRGSEAAPLVEKQFSVYERQDIGKSGASWKARNYSAWQIFDRVARNGRTVPAESFFQIRQGVRLGNDVFVVSRDYVQKLRKRESRFFRPAVMNASITDGNLDDKFYVFYPYGKHLPALDSEKTLQKHVPTYFEEALLPAKSKLSRRHSLKDTASKWWDLLRPRSWQIGDVPKIVSKYFGGPHSFAFDKNGEFVVVVGQAWILKPGTVRRAITEEDIYSSISTYLNTSAAAALIEYFSIQVAGGQWDLSRRYLGSLPVLDLSTLRAADISKLVTINSEGPTNATDRWNGADALVDKLLAE